MSIPPSPPSVFGFLEYSACENTESTEQPKTSQLCFLNVAAYLENSMISVGHTNVKFKG